jgi:hypothetical protein
MCDPCQYSTVQCKVPKSSALCVTLSDGGDGGLRATTAQPCSDGTMLLLLLRTGAVVAGAAVSIIAVDCIFWSGSGALSTDGCALRAIWSCVAYTSGSLESRTGSHERMLTLETHHVWVVPLTTVEDRLRVERLLFGRGGGTGSFGELPGLRPFHENWFLRFGPIIVRQGLQVRT